MNIEISFCLSNKCAEHYCELPLAPGMRLDFLFDFGDQWHFTLHAESVNAELTLHQPRVLEKHGTAPKQYGGW